jgi:hypothetical protein
MKVYLLIAVLIIIGIISLNFKNIYKSYYDTKQVKCANNLKQLGIVLTIFADDNNDILPKSLSVLSPSYLPTTNLPCYFYKKNDSPYHYRFSGNNIEDADNNYLIYCKGNHEDFFYKINTTNSGNYIPAIKGDLSLQYLNSEIIESLSK